MQKTPARSAGLDLPADLALLGSFWDAIAGIRKTLAADEPHSLGEARAMLSAIRGTLDEHVPGPPDAMPTLIPDGDDLVAVLAARLRDGELFTCLAAEYAGEPVSARVVRDGGALMTRSEREWLQAHLDASGRRPVVRRRGELRTARGNKLAANVTSLLIPSRVPEQALRELEDDDTPLGAVLAPYGLHRELLWLWPYCSDDTVLNVGARLWLPGPGRREWPAGMATEQVRRPDWWAAS
jgi:hypothetical protein